MNATELFPNGYISFFFDQGAIGMAINGVAIYSDADASSLDAYINEGNSFDACGGHPSKWKRCSHAFLFNPAESFLDNLCIPPLQLLLVSTTTMLYPRMVVSPNRLQAAILPSGAFLVMEFPLLVT